MIYPSPSRNAPGCQAEDKGVLWNWGNTGVEVGRGSIPSLLSTASKLPEGMVKLLTWIVARLRCPNTQSWCTQETTELGCLHQFSEVASWLLSSFSAGDVHRASGERKAQSKWREEGLSVEIVSASPRLSGKVLGTLAFLVLNRAYSTRLPHPSFSHFNSTVQVQDLAGRQHTHQD